MKKLLFLFLGIITLNCVPNDPYPRRSDQFDIKHYKFELALNDSTNKIEGIATIDVSVRKHHLELVSLDLVNEREGKGMKVKKVLCNNQQLKFQHDGDELRLVLAGLPKARIGDEFRLEVYYEGIPADGLIISQNKYEERTFFGDNWPNRAHHWLPVVDHPYEKATCEFIVTAPDHYKVVANGALISEKAAGKGYKQTHWKEAVELPTKVMVIGAARFAVDRIAMHRDSIPVETWVFPQNHQEGKKDYQVAADILDFFAEKIAPYPYEKLANVQSKTRYGGMENASCIFYFENSVTGKGLRKTEKLIAHEIVHQWFGNSASEADWHHIWLSEGFARYLEEVYIEETYGETDFRADMKQMRDLVIEFHEKVPHLSVVDSSITDLNHLLNRNSYEKGAWILHMLRHKIGDEVFWKGLQAYYEKYQFNNALSSDFQEVMEEVSGEDLSGFFHQWLLESGHPKLEFEWDYKKRDQKVSVTIRQVQQAYIFNFPLEIAIYSEGETEPTIHTLYLTQAAETFELDHSQKVKNIELDPHVNLLMQ